MQTGIRVDITTRDALTDVADQLNGVTRVIRTRGPGLEAEI
jgi:hypothetical protein